VTSRKHGSKHRRSDAVEAAYLLVPAFIILAVVFALAWITGY